MKNRISALIIVGGLFLSCDNQTVPQSKVYESVSLTLSDGMKWEVPSPMNAYMDSSLYLIDRIERNELTPAQAAGDLVNYKNGFVSNCSMEGKGHDVLHAWLIPYLGVLEDLSETNSQDQIEQIKVELIEAKRLYREYFK